MTMVETKEITDQKLVWWREVLLAYGFYFVYSRIRGSGRVAGLQPLHNARRRIAYYSIGSGYYASVVAWDGVMSLGFGMLIVWIAFGKTTK